MRYAIRVFILVILCLGAMAAQAFSQSQAPASRGEKQGAVVEVSVFWEPGCPYCQKAKRFLERHAPALSDWLVIRAYDVKLACADLYTSYSTLLQHLTLTYRHCMSWERSCPITV